VHSDNSVIGLTLVFTVTFGK